MELLQHELHFVHYVVTLILFTTSWWIYHKIFSPLVMSILFLLFFVQPLSSLFINIIVLLSISVSNLADSFVEPSVLCSFRQHSLIGMPVIESYAEVGIKSLY